MADKSTKSRRSKKSSAPASVNNKTTNKTETNNVTGDDSSVSLEEQLDRALVAVTSSQEQTLKIHHAWKSQIQRISIIVLVVIMTQVKAPGSACMESVKHWNTKMEQHNADLISNAQTIYLMAKDSVMEGMSFFCSLCIVFWVSTIPPQAEFSSLLFQVASALLPVIVYTYSNDRVMGCLRHFEDPFPSEDEEEILPQQSRSFPVVLIFYVVTSLSVFAMNVQRKSGEENIRKVQKLKQDLLQSKKKK